VKAAAMIAALPVAQMRVESMAFRTEEAKK
jgi:hypothetical protein